jgi:hypothetical protein
MAINNTNAISTKLGLDIASTYVRLEIYLGTAVEAQIGLTAVEAQIGFHAYADKAAYLAGESMINNVLDFDLSNYGVEILLASDVNLDNLHDLAIAELVVRGLDATKLAKTDLV